MSALTYFFALAGVLPFTVLLVRMALATTRQIDAPGRLNFGAVALSLALLASFAAIDAGFATLTLRTLVVSLGGSLVP